MRHSEKEDVRASLADAIGREPDSEIWAFLVEDGKVEAITEEGDWDAADELLGYLIDDYRKIEKIRGPKRRQRKPTEEIIPPGRSRKRLKALLRLTANRIEQSPKVREFREDVLGGELVDIKQIRDWMGEREPSREDAMHFLGVQITWSEYQDCHKPGHELLGLDMSKGDIWESSLKSCRLPYRDQEDLRRSVKLGIDGPLRQLRSLVKSLSFSCRWPEADLVVLILTGVVPRPSRGIVNFEYSFEPESDRVVMKIHPDTTIDELRRTYSRNRKVLLDLAADLRSRGVNSESQKPALRRQSRTPLVEELALFAHEVNDGRSTPEAHKEWKRRHSDDDRKAHNFGRAMHQACERLGRPLDWKRGSRTAPQP